MARITTCRLQLRNLLLHEPLDELRMGARYHNDCIGPLRGLDDHHLDVIPDRETLARDLLLGGSIPEPRRRRTYQMVPRRRSDDGVAKHAALVGSLAEDPALLDVRQPLGDGGAGGRGGLPGEVRDVDRDQLLDALVVDAVHHERARGEVHPSSDAGSSSTSGDRW